MFCQRCGAALRIENEQVGIDQAGYPLFHRVVYCDNCKLRQDIDVMGYNQQYQNQQNRNHKKSQDLITIIAIIGSFIILLLFLIYGEQRGKDITDLFRMFIPW